MLQFNIIINISNYNEPVKYSYFTKMNCMLLLIKTHLEMQASVPI